ncbi:hypothetical protein B0H10DRAFT_2000297 [Mycena sp. CBHHK59/15]|nr:hypothetical protein B0H10DRAFT_2000297 [Mycena sp. CBHHK59/15]
MSSTNDPPKPIQITHVIHPDNKAHFKALATSKKDIRTTRSTIHTICSKCLKSDEEPGLALRRCGKCKGVWYCSKECQIKHWPHHKKSCNIVDGSGILKLVNNLNSNPLFNQYLQACFILDFDLLRHPQLDKPFMARIDIGIEPADTTDLFNIFLGQPLSEEKIKGMVQVNAFTPATPAQMAELTPKRKEIWRKARESLNKGGFPGDSMGLMEFANGESEMTITVEVHIQRAAMQLVELGASTPFEMTSAITGEVTKLPFTVETCMEFMNTHIRADKKNQLLLRTEMRPTDIQIIRDAGMGSGDSDRVPVQILKEKMAREQIFRPLIVNNGSLEQVLLV